MITWALCRSWSLLWDTVLSCDYEGLNRSYIFYACALSFWLGTSDSFRNFVSSCHFYVCSIETEHARRDQGWVQFFKLAVLISCTKKLYVLFKGTGISRAWRDQGNAVLLEHLLIFCNLSILCAQHAHCTSYFSCRLHTQHVAYMWQITSWSMVQYRASGYRKWELHWCEGDVWERVCPFLHKIWKE